MRQSKKSGGKEFHSSTCKTKPVLAQNPSISVTPLNQPMAIHQSTSNSDIQISNSVLNQTTTAPHFRSLQLQTQSLLQSSQLEFFENIHPEIQVNSTSFPAQFPQFPVANVVTFSNPRHSVQYVQSAQFQQEAQALWHAGMSPHPYSLCILSNIVKKCYGCGTEFNDKYRVPPCNIVVKHVDRRVMRCDEHSGQIVFSPDYNNTYYHPAHSHIAKKNPLFSGVVNVSRSLWENL